MAQAGRTFRVFISSTFSDLKAERNALQQDVFPRLQELCARQGCQFQAIDLRWGVSDEADLNQRTMRICLDEIARCQATTPRPNFIILLGDRYGWQPLPEEIPSDEFEAIEQTVANEADREMLSRWYRRDDNARPPAYCLQPRAVNLQSGQTEPVQTEARRREDEAWKQVEASLWKAIRSAVATLSLDDVQARKYLASATEQEIFKGALSVPDAAEHVFCFFRNTGGLPTEAHEFVETDIEAQERLRQLKQQKLRAQLPNNIHEYEARWTGDGLSNDHLSQLCEDVYSRLSAVIQQEIDRLVVVDPLQAEIASQEDFAERIASRTMFVGRDDMLRRIREHLVGADRRPLVITGVPGAGKSAVIGRSFQLARSELAARVVVRFIGVTPDSSDARALLETLCRQIGDIYGDQSPVPTEYAELAECFPKRLALATSELPLLVFLDGLNQLTTDGISNTFSWLPSEVPEHVHLVVSALPLQLDPAMQGLLPNSEWLKLPPLARSDGSRLLDHWLKEAGRTLASDPQNNQREEVLGKFERNGLPLYLRLAFEEARLWRSYERPRELGIDTEGVIGNLFARLEHPANHGDLFVRHSLGYLSATRHGLSEGELLDVLSADQEVLQDLQRRSPESPVVSRLPVVVWSRLYYELAPYLMQRSVDGVSAFVFSNQALRDVAATRYLSAANDLSSRHEQLARHFRLKADPEGNASWAGLDRRGFSELAFHLYRFASATGDTDELYRLAHDSKFRERQFVVLERLEPVAECLNFAIDHATVTQDPVATVRHALARGRMNLTLARTFLYRLCTLAESNPKLATSVAELIPTPAERLMALALVAWICTDVPDRRPTARRLLIELPGRVSASVSVFHVPVLLNVIRDMVEQGIDEALELVQLIPDCPLRHVSQQAWADSSPALRRLADSLSRPARTKVLAPEIERMSEVNNYARECLDSGLTNRAPARVEEKSVHRFGRQGPSELWLFSAARSLVTGHKDESRWVLNRSLYVSQAQWEQPVRLQLALMAALAAVGERDLSRENRDKVTSYIRGMYWFISDETTRKQLAPVVEDLAEWHDELFMRDYRLPNLLKLARKALASEGQDNNEDLGLLFHEASKMAAARKGPESSKALNEIVSAMAKAQPSPRHTAVRLAAFSLAEGIGDTGMRRECLAQPSGDDLNPELLFTDTGLTAGKANAPLSAVFDALLGGDVFTAAAVAIALRLKNQQAILFALVQHACRRGADSSVVDAVVSQIPLLETVTSPTLRRISDEINVLDSRFGVASGLGASYFVYPWLYLTCIGTLCLALGSAAKVAYTIGATVSVGGILGSLSDLLIWRKMDVWGKPERSRHLATDGGSFLAAWGIFFFLQDDLGVVFSPAATGYGFFATLGSAVLFLALLYLISYQWGISKFARGILTSLVLLASATALIFSSRLDRWIGAEWLAGIFSAGAVMLGLGLNLLVKHIPVRRFYRGKGIRIGDDSSSDKLAEFELSRPERQNPRLRDEIVLADRAMISKQMQSAYQLYTRAIADPDFDSLPAPDRAGVYLNRGLVRRTMRDFDGAMEDYGRATQLNPRSPSAYMNAGLVLVQDLHDPRSAYRAFSEAVDRDPGNPENFSCRAATRMEFHDYEGAESDLTLATMMDPHHANALTNLGNLNVRMGKVDRALEFFAPALEAAPKDHEIRFFYARALELCGKHEEAQRVLRQDLRAVKLWQADNRGQRRF